MSSEPAIRVEGLSKAYQIYAKPNDRLAQMLAPVLRFPGQPVKRHYREFWALKDINLSVARGQTMGIVGRNGSGKSTLLQIICGTLAPTTGLVAANGRICALLELGAGFNPEFTGEENALLSGQLQGLSARDMRERLPEIEAFAEIGDFFRQPVKTYSSGMYVRLAFAAQAFVEPDILVIDEALAVGDARFQAKCLGRLESLRAAGTSILFVSHDVATVRRFCDSAVWINQGRMEAAGNVADVTGAYIEHLFAGSAAPASPPPSAPAAAAPAPEAQTAEAQAPSAPEQSQALIIRPEMRIGAPNHLLIRRWGSRPGLIEAVIVTGADGAEERAELDVGAPMQIVVAATLPDDLPRDFLCISVAIKSPTASDLVITSTWDDPACRFSGDDRTVTARFRMDNLLNQGEYVVVASIEDRSANPFHYYDFVEGAAYLRSRTLALRWGVYVPPVAITLETSGRSTAVQQEPQHADA